MEVLAVLASRLPAKDRGEIISQIFSTGGTVFPEDQLPAGTLRALRDPTAPEEPDL
jgi:hypothetical protein